MKKHPACKELKLLHYVQMRLLGNDVVFHIPWGTGREMGIVPCTLI